MLIDGNSDGVAQMTSALENMQGVTGIHLIGHGEAGSLQLGTSTLDANSMSTVYRQALTSIHDNLSDGADILIYGCNFGAGAAGQQRMQDTAATMALEDDVMRSAKGWLALGAMLRQRDAFAQRQALAFALERSELERKAADARLRTEVEQLRVLRLQLRAMPRRRVPRSFALNPAAYSRPKAQPLLAALPSTSSTSRSSGLSSR